MEVNAVKVVDFMCPHCGGALQIEEGRKQIFCEYCGAKLLIDDGNHTLTVVNVIRDEARIKEADVELKKVEQEAAINKAKADKIVELERINAKKLAKTEIKKAKIEARALRRSNGSSIGRAIVRGILKLIWALLLFGMLSAPGWGKKLPEGMNVQDLFNYMFMGFVVLTILLLVTHRRRR